MITRSCIRYLSRSALACCLALAVSLSLTRASAMAAQSTSRPTLEADHPILDLRLQPWEYVHDAQGKATIDQILARTNWAPIHVGRSWNLIDHSELRKGVVWVRTNVMIPETLRHTRISFQCTAMGGSGDVFVNGRPVGEHVDYSWMYEVAGPFRIELTDSLRYGEMNEILVRCDPKSANRSVGLIGWVCLQDTLPFHRNGDGGIVLEGTATGRFQVLLHYGDAVLARGDQTEFSAEELAALPIPIYGLREDELISVIRPGRIDVTKLLKVEVNYLHRTFDDRPTAISCDALPSTVGQGELLSIPLHVAGTYRNPFEPREVDVTCEVHTPSGKTETVHGFFAQDYKPVQVGEHEEILLPILGMGTPWRLNYRPREAGRHTIRLFVTNGKQRAEFTAGTIEVTPRTGRGFLRISKSDPRFFEFENGESFYGTGPSGWFRQTENWMFGGNTRWIPIEAHKKYYERKKLNRSSYEYLARWHFGQIYLKGGYIDAYVMWKLDQAVRAMEANGIYWITYGRPGAGRTYRNGLTSLNQMAQQKQIVRQNGLATEDELGFNTGGRIELFQMVSRLADSPAIWIWTCSEEQDAAPSMLPFHNYIRSLDIYQHPHAIGEGPGSIALGSNVEIMPGWYGWSFEKCIAEYSKVTTRPFPVLDVEGSADEDLFTYKDRVEQLAVGFHNHLWLCFFMKMAAGGTEWGNVELDNNGLLFHAAAFSRYLDGENWTKIRWEIASPEHSDPAIKAFALCSPRKTLAWFVRTPASGAARATGASTVKIPVAADGNYSLEFWDTREGKITAIRRVEAVHQTVSCELPAIATDLALKLVSTAR